MGLNKNIGFLHRMKV